MGSAGSHIPEGRIELEVMSSFLGVISTFNSAITECHTLNSALIFLSCLYIGRPRRQMERNDNDYFRQSLSLTLLEWLANGKDSKDSLNYTMYTSTQWSDI